MSENKMDKVNSDNILCYVWTFEKWWDSHWSENGHVNTLREAYEELYWAWLGSDKDDDISKKSNDEIWGNLIGMNKEYFSIDKIVKEAGKIKTINIKHYEG